MNPPHGLHCSACGRDLGLEPVGEPGSLRCARCGELGLEVFASGPGRLLDCRRCGGQFVEHALLRDLLEGRQVYGQAVPRKPPEPSRPDPVRYIPCPACETLMTRRNFGGNSGVIVDVCSKHGIWFDAGELPRVMAFVENGGLIRAAIRDQQAERGHRSLRPAVTPLLAPGSPSPVGGTDLLEDLADAARALLSFLGGTGGR
jgi:Zn-finger nucleic acid-binding protein